VAEPKSGVSPAGRFPQMIRRCPFLVVYWVACPVLDVS
jgi:hypothetical protein